MQTDNRYRKTLFDKILKANGKRNLPDDLDRAFAQLTAGGKGSDAGLQTFDDPVEQFVQAARMAACEVERLNGWAPLAKWLTDKIPPHALVALADQPELKGIKVATGTDDLQQAQWAVAKAELGIAETGTVCLHSDSVPSALLFLVEFLVVVVRESDVVARQEDAWRRLGIATDSRPRALHLITGPSRTADVEQMLQLGAHGPRELMVLLIKD